MLRRVEGHVHSLLGAIDSFVRENLEALTGAHLAMFYSVLQGRLKEEYFGGSWGFEGVTELLVFRVLYHIGVSRYRENPKPVEITESLHGFYFPSAGLVLSAGRPLELPDGRKWIDITVYEPGKDPSEVGKLVSAIEVKAYPQGGCDGLRRAMERFEGICKHYGEHDPRLALIVFDYRVKNRERSLVWRYLMGEPIKRCGLPLSCCTVERILLSEERRKIVDVMRDFI